MGKWEEMQREMMSFSNEEKEKFDANAISMCICGDCPTYNDCSRGKMQLLFCTVGKSDCTMTMTGCLCPTCPVTKDQGLTKSYYCIRGSENVQREEIDH
jgi:hypothetical protein